MYYLLDLAYSVSRLSTCIYPARSSTRSSMFGSHSASLLREPPTHAPSSHPAKARSQPAGRPCDWLAGWRLLALGTITCIPGALATPLDVRAELARWNIGSASLCRPALVAAEQRYSLWPLR